MQTKRAPEIFLSGDDPNANSSAHNNAHWNEARWKELQRLLRDLVGEKAAVIVTKLLDLAVAGNLSAARYVFKIVGLYPVVAVHEEESDLSLTQALMRELGIGPEGRGPSAEYLASLPRDPAVK